MKKGFHILLASLLLVLTSMMPSRANAAVEDRGIKVGEGELHPYYQLEPHFATNPGRRQSTAGTNDLEILNRLGLNLNIPSDKLSVSMDLSGEYDWYLGLQNASTKQYSDWGLNLDLGMHVAKKRKLSVKIKEFFSRSANAYNPAITSGLSLINNNTGLDLIYKPGGGSLELTLAYNFLLYWYMADYESVSSLQNMRHKVSFQTSWRFFPKTAFNFTISTMPTVYIGGSEGSSARPSYENPNSVPLSAMVGLVGLFTNHLSFIANIGYGASFVLGQDSSGSDEEKAEEKKRNQIHTVVGKLELKYTITQNSAVAVGYDRNVGPASLYRFYAKNEWYINYQQFFFNKHMTLATKVAYARYKYGESLIANNYYSGIRQDGLLSGEAAIGYNCKRIFSISLVDRIEFRHSDYITYVGTHVGYLSNNLFIRMDVRY